ncbi:hypothetical protein D3C75_654020 [compost metagenome]
MAERQIRQVEEIKSFTGLDFAYADEWSSESTYVFIQKRASSTDTNFNLNELKVVNRAVLTWAAFYYGVAMLGGGQLL